MGETHSTQLGGDHSFGGDYDHSERFEDGPASPAAQRSYEVKCVSPFFHATTKLKSLLWATLGEDGDTLELHTRGGKTSKLLGHQHASEHVASLSLALVASFESQKVDQRWSMLIKFQEPISFERLIPELGKNRTSDLLILETKDRKALQVIQLACKATAKASKAAPPQLSESEVQAISAQYWESRSEEKAAYDALRGEVEKKKNALRKANKKLQRIQVKILSVEGSKGSKVGTYTQMDLDAAQEEVDRLYEALRSEQAKIEGMLKKKKEAIRSDHLGAEDGQCLTKKQAYGISAAGHKPPELYVGFVPQNKAASMLSPVA